MRWMRDTVAAIGLATVVGGGLYFQRAQRADEDLIQRAQTDVRRMELEVKYRAATKTTELNARGWPVTIDPAWFQTGAPGNALLDEDRPWVEVAGTQQAELMHPPVRMAVDRSLAAFWYNPYQGVIRARVPVMVSDEKATDMYNKINSASVPSIFVRESVADRPKPPPPKPEQQSDAGAPDQPAAADQPTLKPSKTFTVRKADRTRGKR